MRLRTYARTEQVLQYGIASNEDSDQFVRSCSLIKVFLCPHEDAIVWLSAERQADSDQTARM